MTTPANWYPDPTQPGKLRYWDGRQWTGHTTQPGAAPAQKAPTPPSRSGERADHVSFLGAKKRADELLRENRELRAALERVGALDLIAVETKIKIANATLGSLEAEKTQIERQIAQARASLVEEQARAELQDVGVYQYHHPAESSVALRNEFDAVRAAIKRCVREKGAISASANVTFGNSAAQGRKFVADMSRIMLRAYNAEAENCLKSVKAGNLATAQARLRKSMDAIEKQGSMISLRVTEFYHSLRLRELELAADVHMRIQEEWGSPEKMDTVSLIAD